MGQLIVKELDLTNSNRVLGRWMAHRVAELMRRAESAINPADKETAERECQDLVMRLWEMREQWPSGGPLHRIIPTLHQLLEESPYIVRWAGAPNASEAEGLITKLLRGQRQELRQLCALISAKSPAHTIAELHKFQHENQEYLSEIESYSITLITSPHNLPIFSGGSDEHSDEDTDDIYDALGALEESEDDEVDGFAEFEKQVNLKKEQLLKNVSTFLEAKQ